MSKIGKTEFYLTEEREILAGLQISKHLVVIPDEPDKSEFFDERVVATIPCDEYGMITMEIAQAILEHTKNGRRVCPAIDYIDGGVNEYYVYGDKVFNEFRYNFNVKFRENRIRENAARDAAIAEKQKIEQNMKKRIVAVMRDKETREAFQQANATERQRILREVQM